MNTLEYSQTSIIGSNADFVSLSDMPKARFLLLSDTHGKSDVAEAVIRAFGADCAGVFFTGDGIPDILRCIQLGTADSSLRSCLPNVVALVRGNGDSDTYPVLWTPGVKHPESNSNSATIRFVETLVLPVCGKKVLLTHGHRHGVDFGARSLFASAEANLASIVCFGHTHRQMCVESGGILAVNAGSASRPRGSGPASCAVISMCSTGADTVDFFEIRNTGTKYSFFAFTPQ